MYGKIFAAMYDGTLATRGPWQALVTFQQFIVLADQHGDVDMTPEAIARRTTIPLDIIQAGILALELPDDQSRTPDLEGRRIVRLNEARAWGWRVVNYLHYRKIRSQEERREYMRLYQRDRRSKAEDVNQNVNTSKQCKALSEISTNSSKQYAVSSKDLKSIVGQKPDVASLEPEKRTEQTKRYREDAVEILNFLNARANRAYRPVAANIDHIVSRFKEGFTPAECRQVIAKKLREWGTDAKMERFVRPKTLFNRTNFANYAGELVLKEA